MKLQQFYRETGKITLFPGSVDDLNTIESLSNSNKQYELMPVDSGRKYLTGAIIPSLTEVRELMKEQISGISALGESGLAAKLLDFDTETISGLKDHLGDASKIVEQLAKQMFENPAIMGTDIRMKAKKIGANGLIHIQLYNKEETYMGVPVRLQK